MFKLKYLFIILLFSFGISVSFAQSGTIHLINQTNAAWNGTFSVCAGDGVCTQKQPVNVPPGTSNNNQAIPVNVQSGDSLLITNDTLTWSISANFPCTLTLTNNTQPLLAAGNCKIQQ